MNRLTKLVLIVVFLLISVSALQAQDLVDEGNSLTHPAELAFGLGYYFQDRGDHERAIEEFTNAIELLPTWGNPYAARGDSYAAMGEWDRAIADYDTAIEIYPDFVSVLYMRGRAYHTIEELELAEADYLNAIGQYPEYALPYWGLADLQYEQGEMGAALESYGLYLDWIEEFPNESIADVNVLARVSDLQVMAAAGLI
jgi:tetratricopeptide (TPR) repeat protein